MTKLLPQKRTLGYLFIAIIFLLSALIYKNIYIARIFKGKDKYNLIFIMADALRKDALGCYGAAAATPNIDRLSEQGAMFLHAYSLSNHTLPSVTGLFTSMPPSQFKMGLAYKIFSETQLLSQQLQNNKYHTAAFLAHWGLKGKDMGLTKGFDSLLAINHKYPLIDIDGNEIDINAVRDTWIAPIFPNNIGKQIPDTMRVLTQQVVHYLDRIKDNNFYLWIHFMDPHDPYAPPFQYIPKFIRDDPDPKFGSFIDFEGMFLPPHAIKDLYNNIKLHKLQLNPKEKDYIKSLYLAEVRYLDDCLGILLESLKRNRLMDKTIIVFTSDHGEEFWDNGDFSHGQNFSDVLVNVPLIIYHPDFMNIGKIEFPLSHIDLMPTLYEWLNLELLKGHYGRSISRLFKNESLEIKPIFSEEGFYNQNSVMMIYKGK